MPHFIIDCSQDIILDKTPDEIMTVVYNAADSTGLFAANDIKVRIQPAQYYKLGENKKTLSTFSDILWKDAARNKKRHFQNSSSQNWQHFFRMFLFLL